MTKAVFLTYLHTLMLSFITGTKDKRVLRGGSFIDSIDGSFNHLGKLNDDV